MHVMKFRGGGKMAVSVEFKEAVEQNKITRARIMMKDSLLLDSSGKEFDEMLKYAKENMQGYIDEHDGEIFKPSSEWNEDYLNDQMVAVVNNFSDERIGLLKDMVKALYSKKETPRMEKVDVHNDSDGSAQTSNGASGIQIAGACMACAGAIALICGVVIVDVPIVVPIAGGVAIGVGAYLFLKK